MEAPLLNRVRYAARRLVAAALIVFGIVVLISGAVAIALGDGMALFATTITAMLLFGVLPTVVGLVILRWARRHEQRDLEQAAEGVVRQIARRGDGTFTAHDLAAAGTTLKDAQRILGDMTGYGFVEYAPASDGGVRYRLSGTA